MRACLHPPGLLSSGDRLRTCIKLKADSREMVSLGLSPVAIPRSSRSEVTG